MFLCEILKAHHRDPIIYTDDLMICVSNIDMFHEVRHIRRTSTVQFEDLEFLFRDVRSTVELIIIALSIEIIPGFLNFCHNYFYRSQGRNSFNFRESGLS